MKEYYGIIYGDLEDCKSLNGNDYVICYRLDDSFKPQNIMIYTKNQFLNLKIDTKKIKITKKIINII